MIEGDINDEVTATNHAYERGKERFGWSEKVLVKMMKKAFNDGIQHKNTKGTLQRYITKLWFDYKHCNNVRIYGEVIFFFSDKKLITLYHLDPKLRKHLKYCK